MLDLGGGELAYLALAAFPTARTEWKAGDRFPPVFTFEWIPATNEVLASRPDGEPEKVSGEVRLASLSVSEEQRFARLKREALGPGRAADARRAAGLRRRARLGGSALPEESRWPGCT